MSTDNLVISAPTPEMTELLKKSGSMHRSESLEALTN